MKICENCGAHLDAGERCDCEAAETLQDVLSDPETMELVRDLQRLPPEKRAGLKMYVKGRADEAADMAAGL